ncbi:sarcosine oxidase subunit delta [Sneathiella sp.]|uniref:sarcosine oxidase subunit delta n=1 Tax=Sneathiella sp. TaxID=1964365 RepID=UPI00356298DC
MVIKCPFCGPRADVEFVYGGAAGLTCPPDDAGDTAMTDYLYRRENPIGPHRELWVHRHGCGIWIEVERNTLNHVITRTGPVGETR